MTEKISFLEDGFLIAANMLLKLSDYALKALLDAAAVIRGDESLRLLAEETSRQVFSAPVPEEPSHCFFPSCEASLGQLAPLFYCIVLTSELPSAQELHKQWSIPHEVTVATFSDMRLWMEHYFKKYGAWGTEVQGWLVNHFTGRIFRLGRLQYMQAAFRGNVKVYRRRRTASAFSDHRGNTGYNNIIALAENGIRFRKDGQIDGTDGIFDKSDAWESRLVTSDGKVSGNQVSPYGYAISEPVTLALEDWELVLEKGDPVLDMHIPEDGSLDEGLCRGSVNQALHFFPLHFPDRSFKAYSCTTWLFDSQYQSLLPPRSNIVRFQREFYLYPVMDDGSDTLIRVFGEKNLDLTQAKGDTMLQKAVLGHLSAGGHLRNAGGFILKEDLDWGKAIYQTSANAV